jgi:dTDP-4-amino-4,6-dideoxygalactose transaminase
MRKIPLIKPYITQEVKDKVCEVLDSGYLTEGSQTLELEKTFQDYIGCRHALAVTSCTVGLEMALRALGIGPGDEVIVPDYTYPATADAVAIAGGSVVIVDVDPDSMLFDYDALEKAITPQTKAAIPVSLFGNPLDYRRLNAIKQKYNIYIVEDAACSIGADYRGTRVGNLADITVFSLHPRKFITTGEGGMITTNTSKWADWMRSYKHFGMEMNTSRLSTDFVRIGTNAKLSNLLAAIGLVQMQHVDALLERRRELALNYIRRLEGYPQIKMPQTTPSGRHSYQSFCVFIENRNRVMQLLRKKDIEVQIGTYALHHQKAFADDADCRFHGDMPGSTYAFDHTLTLPLYHEMSDEDQKYVVRNLIDTLDG